MNVADVMATSLVTVAPETPWKQIAEKILDTGVSGLPVVDDDGNLVGLVTEADLIRRPAFGSTAPTAAELMTTALITAIPQEHVRTVARRVVGGDRRRRGGRESRDLPAPYRTLRSSPGNGCGPGTGRPGPHPKEPAGTAAPAPETGARRRGPANALGTHAGSEPLGRPGQDPGHH